MSRFWRWGGVLLLILCGSCSPSKQRLNRLLTEDSTKGEKFVPIRPEEWTLPNGLKVLFIHDPELPIIKGSIVYPGGVYWQGDNELGVASAMGDAMRSGGAGALSPNELDLELERLGASIGSSVSNEYGRVNFVSLSRDAHRVFALLSDVVRRPRFDLNRLDLWKGQSIEKIRRRKDDPETVATVALTQLLYPKSLYGRVSSSSDISKITREDLIRMHSKFVVPDRAYLAVVGNIHRADLEELVLKEFGSWRAANKPLPQLAPVTLEAKPGIYFVTLPLNQSTIFIGQQGVPRLTPDHIQIDAFNALFGTEGLGSSRLFRRIRAELGLAYGVFGAITPGRDKGMNLIVVQTKNETATTAVVESLRVLTGLQSAPVSENELSEMKRSIANSFIFNFATPSESLGRSVVQMLLGYPPDYDETYLDGLNAVSSVQVQQVAKSRWDIKKSVIVVVGNNQSYEAFNNFMKSPPSELSGLPLYKLTFDEKLNLRELE